MLLTDVNVLVYAHREDAPRHEEYRRFIEEMVNGDSAYGASDHILAAFLRVATHTRVFKPPSPTAEALSFARVVRSGRAAVPIRLGTRHWSIFEDLIGSLKLRGADTTDAWLAALAIEHGCEWWSADVGFGRFRALRWHNPLDQP